ncbi:hypothetical protein FKM82_015074 [Ascaphus truei]
MAIHDVPMASANEVQVLVWQDKATQRLAKINWTLGVLHLRTDKPNWDFVQLYLYTNVFNGETDEVSSNWFSSYRIKIGHIRSKALYI